MGGPAWLKITMVLLAVLVVGTIGWTVKTRNHPAGHTRTSAFGHSSTGAPRHGRSARSARSAPSAGEPSGPPAAPPPLSEGVTVRGTQLIDRSGNVVRLEGVDVSGTQSACVAGTGFATGPLDASEAAAIASWHMNAVRVPLNEDCWLGINGVDPAYAGAGYQHAIEQWVADLNGAGLLVIVDLDFVAPGSDLAKAEWPMADEDHAPAFWSSVAAAFASDPGVVFDPFNEPYLGGNHPTAADWSCWLSGCVNATPIATTTAKALPFGYRTAGMQQLVDVIRAAGARQPIMLGGLNWSGDPCGVQDAGPPTTTCPEVRDLPSDPQHQLIVDFHTFLPNSACKTPACWTAMAASIEKAGLPVVTGEFGEKDCSAAFIDAYMSWADSEGISYLAWTWSVNSSQPCTVGNGRSNHYLLQSWAGQPSTLAPDGQAYQAHLQQLYEQLLNRTWRARLEW